MAIKFKCPCGRTLSAPDGSEGKKARCPKCREVTRVPGGAGRREESAREPAVEGMATEEPEREEETPPAASDKAARLGLADLLKAKEPRDRTVVLVVDDEPDAVATMQEMLETGGYEVVSAGDGQEAIQKVYDEKPDLIILDVMLPSMTGFQVCKHIKDPMNDKSGDCWRTPVLMVTAQAKGRDVQYAKSVGADGFMKKPFEARDLYRRLERLLRRGPH